MCMGFKGELGKSPHLVKNTDDERELAVDRVASQITIESLALKKSETHTIETLIEN